MLRTDGDELVCSDGKRFPNTGMGGQSAAGHEDSLTRVREKAPVSIEVVLGDTRVLLTPRSSLSVARVVREPGRTSTWYPLHIRWGHGERWIRIRRTQDRSRF